MLRFVTGFLATALIASAAMALPAIGKPAPDFKAMDAVTGKPVALSTFKGKTVVLEWNNPDCPFVKKFYSVGAMQKLQETATADGVVWIAINSSARGKEGHLTMAAAQATYKAVGSKATHYLLDGEGIIGHAYGAKTTPHMYVIDKEGTLAYMGAIDNKESTDSADIEGATNYVTLALAALKDGQPVKTAVTRSYGCFVKY